MGPCNRYEGRIYAKKRKGVPVVKKGKRGDRGVYKGTAEKEVHMTVKVTTDDTGIFCRKEGWKEEDGSEL